jgi:cyclophilin family peptidyl-prolyl cis-trans isomerase
MASSPRRVLLVVVAVLCMPSTLFNVARADPMTPKLGDERFVLQTSFGDITLALYDGVASATTAHVKEMLTSGMYATNHFFRVDAGFVAQIADVKSGRRVALNEAQRQLAERTVPGEFSESLKHERGRLSMARYDDPNSGTSSFSVMLGKAPHLDGKYAIFGEVVDGMETTMRKIEQVETTKNGIFVMPVSRVEIEATYVVGGESRDCEDGAGGECEEDLKECRARADSLATELHDIRHKKLPGNR